MATNRYDRNRLIAVLKDQTDIDPVTYDASYTLLPETVKAYRSVTDFSRVGYRDMDLLYNMVIRTGRSTLEDKKAAIRGSHLPESEQNRLIGLLDEVAAKAERGEYEYRSARQPAQAGEFGMFGTCFFSFEERISEEDARDFVRMCMDVQETQEEDDCLESVNQVFSKGWKDRRIGPLSLILHCLKPDLFPIMNPDEGTDSIFPVLWSNVRRDKTAKVYIPNVKVIRERRNRMFSFRNYRVFENVSFSLGDYLLTPPERATISLEKLDEAVASYKANFAATDAEEHYKFAAIRCWQENFQGWEEKDPSEFPDILSRATREAGNLLTRNFFYARKMIQIIAEAKPAYTRTMFRNLFAEEEEPVLNRVAQFWEDSEIFFRISGNPNLNTYQGPEASTVYLFFRFPEKYGFYMSSKFEAVAGYLGYSDIPYSRIERTRAYQDLLDQIWEHIREDAELLELHRGRLDEACYPDPNAHVLAEDIAYYIYHLIEEEKKGKNGQEVPLPEGYYPTEEEYSVDISAATFERIFTEIQADNKERMNVLYRLYRMDGSEGTCTQLAERYGRTQQYYSTNLTRIAATVLERADQDRYLPEDPEEKAPGSVTVLAFLKHNGDGSFTIRLRQPVKEAIASMEQKGLFAGEETKDKAPMVDFERNIILYGPPGTGKTYQSVQYATAILEGVELGTIQDEPYEDVAIRFRQYVDAQRIVFTTFHQTYGYEEFIEGIRPVMQKAGQESGEEIRYTVQPGIFRELCARAEAAPDDRFVLVIDEINRGNISRIFGELITLIEPTKRLGTKEELKVTLPYSGDTFGVPDNVYLLGTMNTADRSIALIDTALRRRFRFREILASPTELNDIVIGDTGIQLSEMLDRINQRICVLYDREHTIGHAFFMKMGDNPTLEDLSEVFQNSILPLLQEYFFDDYGKIWYVLGDNQKKDEKYRFLRRREVKTDELFGKGAEIDAEAEFTYEIQPEAFQYAESYIGIYQN